MTETVFRKRRFLWSLTSFFSPWDPAGNKAMGLVPDFSMAADNIYVSLTAKGLRPDMMLMTRRQEESAEKKLLKVNTNSAPVFEAGNCLMTLDIAKGIPRVERFAG